MSFLEVPHGHHGYLSTIQGDFQGGEMVPNYCHPGIEEAENSSVFIFTVRQLQFYFYSSIVIGIIEKLALGKLILCRCNYSVITVKR